MRRRPAQYTAKADEQLRAQTRRSFVPCGRPALEILEAREFATGKLEPEPAGRTETGGFVTAGPTQYGDREYPRCGGSPRARCHQRAALTRSAGGQRDDLLDLPAE